MFVEDPDGDEQMGDVDQPEDKQQSETFGESDEKLVSRVFLGLLLNIFAFQYCYFNCDCAM